MLVRIPRGWIESWKEPSEGMGPRSEEWQEWGCENVEGCEASSGAMISVEILADGLEQDLDSLVSRTEGGQRKSSERWRGERIARAESFRGRGTVNVRQSMPQLVGRRKRIFPLL